MHTPWGASQQVTEVAPGIRWVSTASHGGFHLDAERNAKVPWVWRAASFAGRGMDGWYEEDCDWSMVVLTFPDIAKPGDLEAARRTLQWTLRDALEG